MTINAPLAFTAKSVPFSLHLPNPLSFWEFESPSRQLTYTKPVKVELEILLGVKGNGLSRGSRVANDTPEETHPPSTQRAPSSRGGVDYDLRTKPSRECE
jgi:hypothetical protein